MSRYSCLRESTLRTRLQRRGCVLHVHSDSITVADRAAVLPSSGRDHFAVFTPYFRRWLETPVRTVIRPPTALVVPPVRSEPLPVFADLCAEPTSPALAVGGETTGRKLLRDWVAGPIGDYASTNELAMGRGDRYRHPPQSGSQSDPAGRTL
ncbi:hypothetical protein [Nocardia uniformis]|uniref:hypothetical protein n=1 Tax=Nocardia uniformis TaxID=53432 RepID=UPI002892F6D8|nr:hypothetical protein [Nocardia uniformis]